MFLLLLSTQIVHKYIKSNPNHSQTGSTILDLSTTISPAPRF